MALYKAGVKNLNTNANLLGHGHYQCIHDPPDVACQIKLVV
jgi:hypothetical protein